MSCHFMNFYRRSSKRIMFIKGAFRKLSYIFLDYLIKVY